MTSNIYVKLLDEGIDVWRPVEAEKISEDVYRLVETHDETEVWEFETGSVVRVEARALASGKSIVAVGIVDPLK